MKKIEWTRQTPPPVQILKTKALSNVLSLSFTEQQPSVIQEEVSEGFYRLIALPAKTILQPSREIFKENILKTICLKTTFSLAYEIASTFYVKFCHDFLAWRYLCNKYIGARLKE